MPHDLFISYAHQGDNTSREAVAALVARGTGIRFPPPLQPRSGNILRQGRHPGFRPLAGPLPSGVARLALLHCLPLSHLPAQRCLPLGMGGMVPARTRSRPRGSPSSATSSPCSNRNRPPFFLGQLKTLLTGPELPVFSDVAAPWDIAYFIEHLKPKLGEHSAECLVAALNDRAKLTELEQFQEWKIQSPLPLNTPWPD